MAVFSVPDVHERVIKWRKYILLNDSLEVQRDRFVGRKGLLSPVPVAGADVQALITHAQGKDKAAAAAAKLE